MRGRAAVAGAAPAAASGQRVYAGNLPYTGALTAGGIPQHRHINHQRSRRPGTTLPRSSCGSGWAPVHWAASHGCLEALKELVAYGADVTKRTSEGWTALAVAQQKRKVEVVAFLETLNT